jgi:hypothetical protein
MSWSQAQAVAAKIYAELRKEHSPGFVRMILRALERLVNAEEKNNGSQPSNHAP